MKKILFKILPFVIVFAVVFTTVFVLVQSYTPKSPLFSVLDFEEYGSWETFDEFSIEESMLGTDAMKTIAEKDGSQLLFNEKTAEIAVRTADGTVWYSGVQNRLSLSAANTERYSSAVIVKTMDKEGAAGEFTSFGDCVKYGQFTTKNLQNGISVTYRFGKASKVSMIPKAMTKERFEDILSNLTQTEQKYIKTYFGYANYADEKDSSVKKTLEEKYSNIASLKAIYTLKASMSLTETRRLEEYLKKSNYTIEDKQNDHETIGVSEAESIKPHLLLTVNYTLSDGKLNVRAEISKMKATKDLLVTEICLLPFINTQDGALSSKALVSDGSGAVADLSTVRQPLTPEYNEPVYGADYALPQDGKSALKEQISLPCYGLFNDSGAFLAVIKSADKTAGIHVKARCAQEEIGQVSAIFKTLDYAQVKLSETDTQTVNVYSDFSYKDDAELLFTFLPKDKNTYSDIALAYKNNLNLSQRAENKSSLVVHFVGAIDDIEPAFGIPREVIKPLTTFEQAADILESLAKETKKGTLAAEYSGMVKGGLKASAANRLTYEAKLGGKKGFESLTKKADELDVLFYPQIDFDYTGRDSAFDGFKVKRDTAKLLTGEVAFKTKNNPANYTTDEKSAFAYLLNSQKSFEILKKFLSSSKDELGGRISVSAMAAELSSDFKSRKGTGRTESAEYTKKKLEALRESKISVMSTGANVYALPYLSYSTGLACDSNSHPVFSFSVPFLQMVLSGSVNYTMPLLNLFADEDYYALKAIETGSAVYVKTIAAPNSAVKGTKYADMYNVSFENIKESVLRVNKKVSQALESVFESSITGHTKLSEGVFKTNYQNKKYIIVNYNQKEVNTGFGTVSGHGYLAGEVS